MPTLTTELRNKLERVVVEARDAAEAGARAALEALAVHYHEPYPHMKTGQRALRNHLRARGRQLGDRQDTTGRLAIDHLVHECAYEHWHRMLFARFLAENDLLIEPEMGVAISLSEAEELAKEECVNVWVFASRCAQRMLPQIFRPDDPLLQISFATEHMLKLEGLLASLPASVFTASDALGWVYQFWQSKKKDEVNRSEIKIGADELPAVTQLFTEPYMVHFLLHNSLGAWWAGKNLTTQDVRNAKSEDELRRKLALPGVQWGYLRFVRGDDGQDGPWRPAAGTFDGWPKTAAELKVLDPCCGSGHFLIATLQHLVPIRMAEEGLSASESVDAILRDNLHGLEIDERCCQIAAFALGFEVWKMTGYHPLPRLHIACTGIGPQATQEQWLKLAEQSGIPIPTVGREAIENGLLNLHRLFSQARTLGSLINPAELPRNLIAADYKKIQQYLAPILKTENSDDELRERAVSAAGMVKAAELLAGEYTLVITNVPYLEQRKQSPELRSFCQTTYPQAKGDLATVFIDRSFAFLVRGGTAALVTPQNWLYLTTYGKLRIRLLQTKSWHAVAKLGPGAFGTISGHVVQPVLIVLNEETPTPSDSPFSLDVSNRGTPEAKCLALSSERPILDTQGSILANPDARVVFGFQSSSETLGQHALCLAGIMNGDSPRFLRLFWEIPGQSDLWAYQQTTVESTRVYGGMRNLVFFDEDEGHLREDAEIRRAKLHNSDERGNQVWGRRGVAITQMSNCPVALYIGHKYDSNIAVVSPFDEQNLLAIWAFCTSSDFISAVRDLEPKMNVTNATFAKLPFSLEEWRDHAKSLEPFPPPSSVDPTEWLFDGVLPTASCPLVVGVAWLLGYEWPQQRKDGCAELQDTDGIVCISSVRGEEPAAERLVALLAAAGITPERARELSGGVDLDYWLRNDFFRAQCDLFYHRPFVWHIWDGRKHDGFHALVSYHKLAEGVGKGRKLLESLTYSYLGDWIVRQKDSIKRGEGGAEDRLTAALELQKRLEAILEGEPPFDIFVRWKPLHQQPIGWEPDVNDGVRINIRPFLASDLPSGRAGAGVLRYRPNIKWTKDRGKESQRLKTGYPWFWGWDQKTVDFLGGKTFDGNRWNDCHYSNKIKQRAREAAKKGGH